jgi:predicted nuclease of predicted toxin-antitoxin system
MRLLFDQQLSPRLVERLADLFPNSSHVWNLGMDQADDRDIWDLALGEGFTLVTKDRDFADLSPLRGFPPKVMWLRLGNCTTRQVEEVLRRNLDTMREFSVDLDVGVLELV